MQDLAVIIYEKTEVIEKNGGKPLKFNVFSFIMLKYENKYFDGHVDVYKNVRRRICIQS